MLTYSNNGPYWKCFFLSNSKSRPLSDFLCSICHTLYSCFMTVYGWSWLHFWEKCLTFIPFLKVAVANFNDWQWYYLSNFVPPVLNLWAKYLCLRDQNVNSMSNIFYTGVINIFKNYMQSDTEKNVTLYY